MGKYTTKVQTYWLFHRRSHGWPTAFQVDEWEDGAVAHDSSESWDIRSSMLSCTQVSIKFTNHSFSHLQLKLLRELPQRRLLPRKLPRRSPRRSPQRRLPRRPPRRLLRRPRSPPQRRSESYWVTIVIFLLNIKKQTETNDELFSFTLIFIIKSLSKII